MYERDAARVWFCVLVLRLCRLGRAEIGKRKKLNAAPWWPQISEASSGRLPENSAAPLFGFRTFELLHIDLP